MNKLYRFFAILFLVFAIVSFVYSALINWLSVKAIISTKLKGVDVGRVPFGILLKPTLWQALLYALVLLLMTIFLFNKSYKNGQRFTMKHIIRMSEWFFLVTTLVYVLHILFFPTITGLTLLTNPDIFNPSYLWLPFPLAWLSLLFILAARIKKAD